MPCDQFLQWIVSAIGWIWYSRKLNRASHRTLGQFPWTQHLLPIKVITENWSCKVATVRAKNFWRQAEHVMCGHLAEWRRILVIQQCRHIWLPPFCQNATAVLEKKILSTYFGSDHFETHLFSATLHLLINYNNNHLSDHTPLGV